MIPRNELLEVLGRCAEEEARVLALYTQYSNDPSFLAGFPPQERVRIGEILQMLQRGSEAYATAFRDLAKAVGEDAQDVF